jgi:hypothetical protein
VFGSPWVLRTLIGATDGNEGQPPVFSIQSVMLVALGFLFAGLLTLLVAPAFWSRAVRMTDKRLRERLPVSEDEIRADKDRIRAEAAMRIHKLEMRLEQADLRHARHRIEISRRDDNIATLERSVASLTSNLDEHQNARRVLEQTVSDRLPKVELRLNEAKGLLFNRDREIAELTQSTKRQQVALEEANSINTQQYAEITRMSSALTTRGARNAQSASDPRFEGELALRGEIEALRSKTSEQASLINRLQLQINNGLMSVASLNDLVASAQRPAGSSSERGLLLASEVLSGGNKAAFAGSEGASVRDADVRALQSKCEDQADEIVRLTASLKTYQSETTAEPNVAAESRIALKARLSATEAQGEQQTETIKRLRTELAAANERLALQASHFMDEMRRLGAGTLPTSAQQRRPVATGARRSLAERVSQARPSLSMVENLEAVPGNANGPAVETPVPAVPVPVPVPVSAAAGAEAAPVPVSEPVPGDRVIPAVDEARRPRLLDRISSLAKS